MKLHWSVKRGGIIVKTYKEHLLTSITATHFEKKKKRKEKKRGGGGGGGVVGGGGGDSIWILCKSEGTPSHGMSHLLRSS